jgi:hypothetical protein
MPRADRGRKLTAARLDPDQITAMTERARTEGLTGHGGEPNRSDLLRLLVDYGLANMPEGWRPAGWTPTN